MLKKTVQILLVLLFTTLTLFAKEEKEAIDHMALATMMFYDGNYKKALSELQIAKDEHIDMDWLKYHSIQGMISLKEDKYTQAITSFNAAINAAYKKVYTAPVSEQEKKKYLFSVFSEKEKKLNPSINESVFNPEKLRRDKIEELYIYISQAYYRNNQYLQTVKALNKAGKKGRSTAGYFTLRAECYWKANDKANAISALSIGTKLFPKDATLLKQKFYYFAELKLYQASIEAAKLYMQKVPVNAQEYISLAQMLMGAGEHMEAIKILEEAKMHFPTSAKVYVLLGHYYNQKDMPHTTAHLFEQGSYYDRKYLKEAAEMYRRSGELSHALYLNSKMSNNAEKTKQKVAIYVNRGEFEKIIGLKDALNRYALLKNDNMRYALAYAYYVVKDYEKAETHLKKIQDDELFSKATVIRKNIEKCKVSPRECM